MKRVCCGFGHREVFENITERINSAVKEAAEQGCNEFYTGGMGQFDEMFSSAVRQLKRSVPNVRLIYVKPYMTKEINEAGDYLYSLYDDIVIPIELAGVHYKAAIRERNRYLIRESDVVILYLRREFGGAYDAKRYAESLGKQIVYI